MVSSSKRRSPELLAPAGDWRTLQAALEAGADAIFFGVRGLNMRANARNFTLRDLPRIVTLCHERQRRAYLTLNVLVLEAELPVMRRILVAAKAAGVDAVIASDFAVISEALGLGLEVHASTQMSVSNSAALLALHKLGISRFVLAREASLKDIRSLRKQLHAQLGEAPASALHLEVFAHGAMCVAVSGRCFMSESATGKSANRGACTQPCRRQYRLVDEQGNEAFEIGPDYVMSPKDLCTMPLLDVLLEAGVDSLKIEGRNRSPEYVAVVVSAYREALDFLTLERGLRGWRERWAELKERLLSRLSEVYNRGFSTGFYHGKPVNEWVRHHGSVASKRRHYVGQVLNFYKKPSVVHLCVLDQVLKEGDEVIIEGPTSGFHMQLLSGLLSEGQAALEVGRGGEATFVSSAPVRRGDKVYVLR